MFLYCYQLDVGGGRGRLCSMTIHLTFCVLLGSLKLHASARTTFSKQYSTGTDAPNRQFFVSRKPAFYLNADPDPGSQTNADPDPDPGQTLKSQKVKFLHEKYTLLKVGNRSKPNMYTKYKSPLKGRFICNIWSISILPYPDPHSQYGTLPKTHQKKAAGLGHIREYPGIVLEMHEG